MVDTAEELEERDLALPDDHGSVYWSSDDDSAAPDAKEADTNVTTLVTGDVGDDG